MPTPFIVTEGNAPPLRNSKQAVALSSVFASVFLTVTKGTVGFSTGSLAILSEAVHSALDLLAASLTYFAVRASDKPADVRHHFGHAKIESVSALIETGLLFLTSGWIIWEAVSRLLEGSPAVDVTWYAMAVIVLSIVVDASRARALRRVARASKSQALEADALHFSSDIVSSMAVLIGLGMVALGYSAADSMAALAVACFVILAGYRLGRRTIDVLIDTAPEGALERVRQISVAVPGVIRIERIRLRPAGGVLFADIIVGVSRLLPLEHARQICNEIAAQVTVALPEAEVLVHAEPLALDTETVIDTINIVASRRDLAVHHIAVSSSRDRRYISLDLEVDEELTISAAHDAATGLEVAIREELGADVSVDIHLDARHAQIMPGTAIAGEPRARLCAAVVEVAGGLELVCGVHHIRVAKCPDGLYLSFHCSFQGELDLNRVHRVTTRLEALLRCRFHDLDRIVIHAGPLRHGNRV